MLNKAIIDLNLLRQNALKIRKRLAQHVEFNAVVKKDAYGHGAPVIANALYKIADSFSVATIEEGIELRRAGIDKDILVLIPIFLQDVEEAVFFDLTITVERIEQVDRIELACQNQNKRAKVHIKFNSGMNRSGVGELTLLSALAKRITQSKHIILDGMFSHLACPQNKKSQNTAENKFLLANNVVKGYNNKAKCHLSASGGFLHGLYYDMVRIGILLYGYMPFAEKNFSVSPIMKVYAPVIKSVSIKKGQTALYGDKVAPNDLDFSLVRYGYADGLMRKEVSGQFNNRCMDVSAYLNGGDKKWIAVIENADVLAKKYKTISYEILTKSAIRAEKIYLN